MVPHHSMNEAMKMVRIADDIVNNIQKQQIDVENGADSM